MKITLILLLSVISAVFSMPATSRSRDMTKREATGSEEEDCTDATILRTLREGLLVLQGIAVSRIN